jgi:hypothetical protein
MELFSLIKGRSETVECTQHPACMPCSWPLSSLHYRFHIQIPKAATWSSDQHTVKFVVCHP